ncbi:MAG: hypothetical protein DRN15_09845 [Thermoprotei archaeon]|nr:MAG: hypothetical protein DRN15_09845 [Thermoprotei archaeon]RLF25338.1 MAG: hypothetical protein DRM97_02150 [Thermoprotei archaeon]
MKCLGTTTIGNFPLKPSDANIALCTELQLKVGIDYPALPQLRDFMAIYIECIHGIKHVEGGYVLMDYPVRGDLSELEHDINIFINVLKEHGNYRRGKLQVIGPLTMCSSIKSPSGSELIREKDLVKALSEALADVLNEILSKYGAYFEVVFIDEPTIPYASWIGYIADEVAELIRPLSEVARRHNKVVGLHVCGKVKGYAALLVELPVDTLHHEVYGSLDNLDAYTSSQLAEYDKKLCIGVIDNKSPTVERLNEVIKIMEKACNRFGYERIAIAPNCGFAALKDYGSKAMKIVEQKLKTMVSAARKIRAKYECVN